MVDSKKKTITGRTVSIIGDDIDTDRIIPARFMKALTFDSLGDHVFEDDRQALRGQGHEHPFDQPKNAGCRILLADRNFGCGSSREHAPQALHRWGIQAVIGQSFGEIFAGNCLSIGMPCIRAPAETIHLLRELQAENSEREFVLDLDNQLISSGNHKFEIRLGDAERRQFLEGTWDALATLLLAKKKTQKLASSFPRLTESKTV